MLDCQRGAINQQIELTKKLLGCSQSEGILAGHDEAAYNMLHDSIAA
jgi:hypothetical protein